MAPHGCGLGVLCLPDGGARQQFCKTGGVSHDWPPDLVISENLAFDMAVSRFMLFLSRNGLNPSTPVCGFVQVINSVDG